MLASSFNFQGKVKKTFYVLTDDKVGSGPRLRPGALSQASSQNVTEANEPMDTDTQDSHEQSNSTAAGHPSAHSPKQSSSKSPQAAPTPSLASKLAAQSVKRKAADPPGPPTSKQRQK